MVHHPNGSPAKHVQVHLDVSSTNKKFIDTTTNEDGIAAYTFNLIETPPSISVTVNISKTSLEIHPFEHIMRHLSDIFLTCQPHQATVDGIKETLVVRPVSSSENSFLYMSVTTKVLSQGESIEVTFHVKGNPEDGQVHYMVRKS